MFRPAETAGQRPTLPTGGRFTPTQGRALPYVLCPANSLSPYPLTFARDPLGSRVWRNW